MSCEFEEVRFEFQVAAAFDGDVGMPFVVGLAGAGSAPSAVADGITLELQRDSADVPDRLGFLVEERVCAVRREDDEESIESQVLQVRLPQTLAPRTGRF